MEKEEKSIFNFEFDTVNKTMTSIFSSRVKVVTDFKSRIITAIKDDVVKYSFGFEEDYSLKNFEQFLCNMARDAKTLEGFSDGN